MNLHLPLSPKVVFDIGGWPITETVVYSWVIIGVIVLGAIILRVAANRAYSTNGEIPIGAANLAEMVTEGINGFVKGSLHHHWKPFAPYLGALGLFLAISNMVGMFGFGAKPPTRDFNLPFALAVVTTFLVIASSIYYKGVFGFIKSFFQPVWWLFPLKIIEIFARLISLTARLFGNILAAFIIMEIIIQVMEMLFAKTYIIGPGVPAIFSFYFDIFDGLLQALVFTFLTTLYIEEGLEE